MKKNNFLTKAFTLLFVALFSLTGARAQTIVSDVKAFHTGPTYTSLSWEGNATQLRYRQAGTQTTYNFDNSTLSPWTTFTGWTDDYTGGWSWSAPDDGHYHGTQFVWAINSICQTYRSYKAGTGRGRNGSADMVISGSFCSNSNVQPTAFHSHAIEPDNYLVSPQVKLGGYISFWAKGMDPADCEENFGVFYTTATNPSRTSTWRQVGSAKIATPEWVQYIFDLGAIRDQDLNKNGYIAIRHYDCYDEDLLCVDDIVLTEPGGDWTYVSIPSGTSYDLTGLSMLKPYQVEVQVSDTWKGTGFTTTTENPVPSEVSADPVAAVGAKINWWGIGDEYEVWYKSEPYDGPQYFFDDFESNKGWTVRDGSNNSSNSKMQRGTVPEAYKFSAHSGSNIYYATSWSLNTGDYQANHYLITPQVLIGNKVKFWVRCNPGYCDEYEVLLSTGGNQISDFTIPLKPLAPVPNVDAWTRISIDVPEQYVDKQGYIAIHHNMYGGNYLAIDDFGIFEPDIPGSGVWQTLETSDLSVDLAGLIPNTPYEYYVVSNKDGVVDPTPARVETDHFNFTTLPLEELVLEDDGQNSPTITALGGGTVQTLTLKDRTLKAGTWNTLCLPVDVSLTATGNGNNRRYNWPGTSTNVDVRTLTGATYTESTKTLTLTFSGANGVARLAAGVPYIIKPSADISGIKFLGVPRIIKAGMNPVTFRLVEGEDVTLMFRGSYDKLTFDATNRSVLFLKSNKLVFPVNGSYINAQRAAFFLKGAQVSTSIGNLIKECIVNLDDEDPTGIAELLGIEEEAGTWYDLNGRKLTGKPAQKGIYINNGKKTIIK